MFGKKKLREENEMFLAQVEAMQEHIDILVKEKDDLVEKCANRTFTMEREIKTLQEIARASDDAVEIVKQEKKAVEESLDALTVVNEEMASLVERTMEKMEEMSKRLPPDTVNGDEAFVKLVFKNDNYEHITPTISINNDSFEQLFNIRAIDDTQAENKNAIRLALLNLGREALEQICSDFMGDAD